MFVPIWQVYAGIGELVDSLCDLMDELHQRDDL